MKRTTHQNKQLYSLLNELNITGDIKADMVLTFTNGRTEKSSEMSKDECQRMIDKLSELTSRNAKQKNRETQHLRRNVFSLFYELNWIDSSMTASEKLTIINNWIIQRTKTGKNDINQLSADELKTLITQLQAVKRQTEENQKKKIDELHLLKTVAVGIFQLTNYGKICLN